MCEQTDSVRTKQECAKLRKWAREIDNNIRVNRGRREESFEAKQIKRANSQLEKEKAKNKKSSLIEQKKREKRRRSEKCGMKQLNTPKEKETKGSIMKPVRKEENIQGKYTRKYTRRYPRKYNMQTNRKKKKGRGYGG